MKPVVRIITTIVYWLASASLFVVPELAFVITGISVCNKYLYKIFNRTNKN